MPATPTTSPRSTLRLTPCKATRPSSSTTSISVALNAGVASVLTLGGRVRRRRKLAAHDSLDQRGVAHGRHVVRARGDHASAQDSHAIGQRPNVGQLVGDQDDREPLVPQLSDDGEEGLDLLWSEKAGRLVEQHEPGPAQKQLDDLDLLALAHRKFASAGVHVGLEPVPLAYSFDLRGDVSSPHPQAAPGERQGDVLQNG